MEFINKLKKIEDIVSKNNDRFGNTALDLIQKHAISTSEKLENDIRDISNKERLMRIGIVGRVKAGKSSLLNAIVFDGKNILPKAATPMTAALTELNYGENYEAEVEFFTQADIENIAKEAKEYDTKLKNNLIEAVEDAKTKPKYKDMSDSEIESQMKPRVIRDLADTNLAASKDQHDRIKNSSVNISGLQNKVINFESLETLQKELVDYVGSSGQYMPFTKSVKIKFPLDSLKDINIIDTPGMNDPVVSREQRTKDELGKCDVIFIVSPAGQFMSKEDLELMDRITQKDGIRELFVVASKCDTQLQGSILDESGGVLNKAFEKLKTDLSGHLHSTLTTLKSEHPEIGNVFDTLINESRNSIIHSSGQAFTIKEHLNDISKLDEGELHTWNLLKESYPNNFSDTNRDISIASLDELSNIKTIKDILDNTAKHKEKILTRKIEDFTSQKSSSIDKYLEDLINYIEETEKEIQSSDIKSLEAQQLQMNSIKSDGITALDSSFSGIIDRFEISLTTDLTSKLNELYRDAQQDITDSESVTSESYQRTIDQGAGFLWWRSLTGTRYKTVTETREVTTVRAGAVKGILNSFIAEIETSISLKAKSLVADFKKQTSSNLIRDLREAINDDNFINASKLRQIINSIVNKIELPDIGYSNRSLPEGNGTLKNSEASKFLDAASNFAQELNSDVKKDISNYVSKLKSNLQKINIGKDLFSELDESIEKLKNDIQNKTMSLEELARIKQDLRSI